MTALNDDQRLLFNGVQCAICKAIFGEDDHPDLPKDLIRSTHKLRSKVNDLIDQHKLLEETKEENQGKEVQSRDSLYREAMRKHAFYLCSHCNDPYYGGTIDCADAFRPPAVETTGTSNSDSNSTAPERKLCSGCAPQSQTVCRNPSEHGAFLTWKCRYCCQPATYVCYGNVHFCKDCHDKNSRGEVLTPVSCPGDSCPYPKPKASSGFHTNGPTQDCEQVYSCSLCGSIPVDASAETWTTEPGSRNFVVNPSGEDGLRGWVSNGSPWMVERGAPGAYPSRLLPTPVVGEAEREPITTNFVSSFRFSTMEQRIDLTKFLRLGEAATRTPSPVVRIEVSARYTRRWDCPSVFHLGAVLVDGREARAPPLSTGVVEAGVHWERASLVFDLGPLAEIPGRFGPFPKLVVSVSGKDSRFWAGNFGSKVADISVRVLGRTPEEIETMVLSEEEAEPTDSSDPRGAKMPWASYAVVLLAVVASVVFGNNEW